MRVHLLGVCYLCGLLLLSQDVCIAWCAPHILGHDPRLSFKTSRRMLGVTPASKHKCALIVCSFFSVTKVSCLMDATQLVLIA